MATIRKLTTKERSSLDRWLLHNGINPLSYRKANKLCDAIAVAKMFNEIQPGLADMAIYTPCLSLSLNYLNWQIFNQQVLRKLDMRLCVRDMENLAQGCVKSVEFLLFTLKCRLEDADED